MSSRLAGGYWGLLIGIYIEVTLAELAADRTYESAHIFLKLEKSIAGCISLITTGA